MLAPGVSWYFILQSNLVFACEGVGARSLLASKKSRARCFPLLCCQTHTRQHRSGEVFTTAPAVTHPLASRSLSGEIRFAERAQSCSASPGLGSFIPTTAPISGYQTTANTAAFRRAGAHGSQTQPVCERRRERAEGAG